MKKKKKKKLGEIAYKINQSKAMNLEIMYVCSGQVASIAK